MDIDIRGILLDKDGTLFGFRDSWAASTRRMIAQEAEGDIVRGRALAEALGFDMERGEFSRDSILIAGTQVETAACIKPLIPSYRRAGLTGRMSDIAATAQMQPVGELDPLLRILRAHPARLALVTNDGETAAREQLVGAGIEAHFDVITGYDSGFGAKPDAGPCLGTAAALDLTPNQCLMVGDSLADLRAGRAAGMKVVAVLTGMASRAELAPYADGVISSLLDLPAWLDG